MSSELDKLRELEAKATPRPWKLGHGEVNQAPKWAITITNDYVCSPTDDHDAQLIAVMRNTFREMLEVCEAAESIPYAHPPTMDALNRLKSKVKEVLGE